MKLEATRKEFTLHDESGYSFQIVLTREDDGAWGASTTLVSCRLNSEAGTLTKLLEVTDRFQSMLIDAIEERGGKVRK